MYGDLEGMVSLPKIQALELGYKEEAGDTEGQK
jgi:hypothetical protein